MNPPRAELDLSEPKPIVAGERIHALDSLRAAAMFLGIVLHAGVSFATRLPVVWPARDMNTHWTFDLGILLIHGFRMQLFFFLSGFFSCLLLRRLGGREFLRQRLRRIGIPFLAGMLLLAPLLILLFVWGFSRAENSVALPSGGPHLSDLPTGHLWFLEYLLIFNAAAVLLSFIGERTGIRLGGPQGFFGALRLKPSLAAQILLLVPLTIAFMWKGPTLGEVHEAGRSIVPPLNALGYFGLFFAAGWWWHGRRDFLTILTRGLPATFATALAAMGVHLSVLLREPDGTEPDYLFLKATSLGGAALYAWLMTFGVTGFFLRVCSGERPAMRYLADASYWCYLAHLPIVLALQIWLAPVECPMILKFGGILAATLGLTLVTYHYLVRYTWLGTLLNGLRHPPGQ